MNFARLALVVLPWLALSASAQPPAPNLLLDVRKPFAQAAVAQTVDRPECISDMVGGARLTGSGQTRAVIALDFVPCADRAVVEFVLRGTTRSCTALTAGPVRLDNANLTTFAAAKCVGFDADGLRAAPTRTTAHQDSELIGISSRFRGPLDPLARSVAGRVYHRREADALRQAEMTVAQKVGEGFEEEAGKMLVKIDASYRRDVRGAMEQRGVFPTALVTATTDDALTVRGRLGATATAAAPPAVAADAELAVRVHESLLNTAATTLFAGKTYTPEQLGKEFAAVFGPLAPPPAAPLPDGSETVLEITFAPTLPVETRFRDGTAAITVRAQGFRADGDEYGGMDITAVYTLQKTATGLTAVRDPQLTIVPPGYVPGKTKLSSSQIALRRIIQRRLSQAGLPVRIEMTELKLPGTLAKIGPLHVAQADSATGWLAIGFKRPARRE